MFPKNHGVVAGPFFVKDGIAVVGIGKAAGAVELGLNAAKVTVVAGVLICT